MPFGWPCVPPSAKKEARGERRSANVPNDRLTERLTATLKGSKLTVGVINLADKYPALIPYDGRPFNYYLYDSYGRTPYVRFQYKF